MVMSHSSMLDALNLFIYRTFAVLQEQATHKHQQNRTSTRIAAQCYETALRETTSQSKLKPT
jgi:hypothetical protein